jgi:hypothetical protein
MDFEYYDTTVIKVKIVKLNEKEYFTIYIIIMALMKEFWLDLDKLFFIEKFPNFKKRLEQKPHIALVVIR